MALKLDYPEVIDPQHRRLLFPILIRLLFGQLSVGRGRSTKETPESKRRSILSFLARLSFGDGELDQFVYMMCRTFVPLDQSLGVNYLELGAEALSLMSQHDTISLAQHLTVEDTTHVPVAKHLGFLNLLETAITQLGLGLKPHVSVLCSVVLTLYEHADKQTAKIQVGKEEEEDDDDKEESTETNSEAAIEKKMDDVDENESGEKFVSRTRYASVRKLCYRRLSNLLVRFASHVSFDAFGDRLWVAFAPALVKLPKSVIHSNDCPSLLLLLEVTTTHPKLIELLAQCPDALKASFECISGSSHQKVMQVCLAMVENLLNNGIAAADVIEGETENDEVLTGQLLIQTHLGLLIDHLSSRLLDTKGSGAAALEGLDRKVLNILCRTSHLMNDGGAITNAELSTLEQLCELLVLYLSPEKRPRDAVLQDVLQLLQRFMPLVSKACAIKHFVPVSRLLGPHKNHAGMGNLELRELIVSVVTAISSNCDNDLQAMTDALQSVSKVNTKHLDEPDFDSVLPVINRLGKAEEQGSWQEMYETARATSGDGASLDSNSIPTARIVLPLLYHCLHSMYGTDSVTRRGCFVAIKAYIQAVASLSDGGRSDDADAVAYVRVLETGVLPLVRAGMLAQDDVIHGLFVQLIGVCAQAFAASDNDVLHGDLAQLINDEDRDMDFFLNITHIQKHRKSRALTRLRRDYLDVALKGEEEEMEEDPVQNSVASFSQQSLKGILLPLALRPMMTAESASDEKNALEGVATVGMFILHTVYSVVLLCVTLFPF
jgi:U3 small nucleolar RNA-associated protein 20